MAVYCSPFAKKIRYTSSIVNLHFSIRNPKLLVLLVLQVCQTTMPDN